MWLDGKFITFEGIEGTGKSTQISFIAKELSARSLDVLTLREPGCTKISEKIRNLLQYDKECHNMFPETELLLFEASRAQLVREVIAPAIGKGFWVLCDRFFDSTTAYQGSARKLPMHIIEMLNSFAAGGYVPDMTVIFDMDPALSLGRLTGRSTNLDRIEAEDLEFFSLIRKKYLEMAKNDSRFVVIDASIEPVMLGKNIMNEIAKKFF
ncbi:MAG: dTMP kinase [Puniceicoccales bacterium]|jgi:dTMP kinase|nr:dTMP kinase [Puniceicoccales bacterium]